MSRTLIKNVNIVNEGRVFKGDVLIEDRFILKVSESEINLAADILIDGAKIAFTVPFHDAKKK